MRLGLIWCEDQIPHHPLMIRQSATCRFADCSTIIAALFAHHRSFSAEVELAIRFFFLIMVGVRLGPLAR